MLDRVVGDNTDRGCDQFRRLCGRSVIECVGSQPIEITPKPFIFNPRIAGR